MSKVSPENSCEDITEQDYWELQATYKKLQEEYNEV
jgi:hypothetical protein